MKSVCVLLQNFYEIDIRVRRKAEALVRAGYRVDVLALRSPDAASASYTLEGVNVETMAIGKKRGSRMRYALEYGLFFAWTSFKLLLAMRRQRYAAVDVNTLPDFLVFAAAPAKWMGAKIILDMHEITPEFYMSKYATGRDALAIRALTLVERMSFRFADRVITINEPIQDLLVARGLAREKSVVIMNAVDEEMFAGDGAGVAPAQPPAESRPVMMYHGTLTRIYGLDVAIRAFALVKDQMPDAEFWIVGGGPERKSLEDLAGKLGLTTQVRFIGSVKPNAIPGWLRQCRVGVLATRQDVFLDLSFSNKLSEYIVMGKAAIVARLKTIRHYFSEDALAYFEPENPEDLGRQMLRMYRDPALRTRYAAKARQEYEPISWAVMKARYLAFMEAAISAR
jgi:glycosyltransferase involved in cell wall biosynthesis